LADLTADPTAVQLDLTKAELWVATMAVRTALQMAESKAEKKAEKRVGTRAGLWAVC